MQAAESRPWIALTLGDPAGIGPEVCLAARADEGVERSMRLCLIGSASLCPADVPLVAAAEFEALETSRTSAVWLASESEWNGPVGQPSRVSGRAALAALRLGVELAAARRVAALVTAPVSKEALHLAGERVEGQTELLARWAGVDRFEMIAIAGELRVMLLTRHMSLSRAIASLSAERVFDHLTLFDETLRRLGIERPRLGLAGLNPHASEGGLFGDEERLHLEPAAQRARRAGLDVRGPLSPDTIFLQAWKGAFDGVLALYHDQAFIPVKLAAPETGLTLIAGLPYLRISPAHGTAFDIAGRGLASPKNLIAALLQAASWARSEVLSALDRRAT